MPGDVIVSGLDDLRRWVQALAAPWPAAAHAAAGEVVREVWTAVATGLVVPPLTAPVHAPAMAESLQVTVDAQGATVTADPATLPPDRAPRDLKPALLHGPKSRIGRTTGLRYNIIPLRHDAAMLPTAVMAALVAGTPVTTLEGIRSKILHGGAPVLAYQPASGHWTAATHYTWRTGLYTGMRLGTHPAYPVGPVTFRTVSERSPAGSWWVPGRAAPPVLAAVMTTSTPLVQTVYSQWWEARLHAR